VTRDRIEVLAMAVSVGLLTIILLGCQGLFAPPVTMKAPAVVMPVIATAADTPPAADPVKPARPARVLLESVPPVTTDNKNGLIDKYRKELKFSASSTWPGWPEAQAVDGELKTLWFSGKDDAAAKGKKPWLQITFPEDVMVARITILGNRDPAWLNGYTILAGKLELLDKDGKVLWSEENEGTGNYRDFDFRPKDKVEAVRSVRFTSLGDQGDQNPFGDIAIAEVQVD
jgi:hypothetical protein